MGEPRSADFLPSRDAFGFPNDWPSVPALFLPTPVRRIGIGNAARGLCGGMVFGTLDYWHAGTEPPARLPAPDDPLFRFIVRRLIESWHIPTGVARYYYWMTLADRGLRLRSVAIQWPRIRAQLDAGQPSAIGLVTVAGSNPLELGRNHQVLAYDYRLAGNQVTLCVYDPNSGPSDDVYIRFDPRAPDRGFTHSINIGLPVRGLFLTPYSPATPPGTVSPQR